MEKKIQKRIEGKKLEKFTFEVPLSMAGKELQFVPRRKSNGMFSTTSSLAFNLPSLDNFKKQTEIVIQSQPKDVAAKNDTQVSLSVTANGEESAKLSYQWQYSADGTSWADCEASVPRMPLIHLRWHQTRLESIVV